jgi:hypothetical protein
MNIEDNMYMGGLKVEYIRKTILNEYLIDIFDIPQRLHGKKAEVIILFSEADDVEIPKSSKRQIGFAKGAEVPNCFFEPLSEEDLQLWGL